MDAGSRVVVRQTPIPNPTQAEGQRHQGYIVTWNWGCDYGFIAQRGEGLDGRHIFVHKSALPQDVSVPLPVGTRLSFVMVNAAKGPKAINVELETGGGAPRHHAHAGRTAR